MDATFKQLAGHVHGTITPGDPIVLSEGPINKEQMEALQCVANARSIMVTLEYMSQASVLPGKSLLNYAGRRFLLVIFA